jgi:DNA (cytosine-5)-methyltransferase 1
MRHGDEYPAAHATAVRLFEKELAKSERRGEVVSKAKRDELFRQMVPPYPVHNFPNRWWKLRPDEPSRTLLAHIGKDTYSHIHFDSRQARTISVREAARLQSFPDGFIFCGTMNPAFRQIGNAVPPVLAWRLAETIRATLEGAQAAKRTKAA